MIAFRPLAAADFPMLTGWLAEPHVRRFVQKTPMTLEDVASKYGPRVRGEQPIICHVAQSDGADFGYLQAYRNRDWPDAADGQTDGISLDLHIGEPAFLGRGLGRAMLDAYVRGPPCPTSPRPPPTSPMSWPTRPPSPARRRWGSRPCASSSRRASRCDCCA